MAVELADLPVAQSRVRAQRAEQDSALQGQWDIDRDTRIPTKYRVRISTLLEELA